MPLGRPPRAPAARPISRASIRSRASRVQSLTSVATWSLRLRAVCSFRPDVAELLDQRRLDVHVDVFALQDERETARPRSPPGFPTDLAQFAGIRRRSAIRHAASIRAWAIEPRMSCLKSRRSKEIDSVNSSTRRSVLSPNRPPQGLPATRGLSWQQDAPCIRFWHPLTQSRQSSESCQLYPRRARDPRKRRIIGSGWG